MKVTWWRSWLVSFQHFSAGGWAYSWNSIFLIVIFLTYLHCTVHLVKFQLLLILSRIFSSLGFAAVMHFIDSSLQFMVPPLKIRGVARDHAKCLQCIAILHDLPKSFVCIIVFCSSFLSQIEPRRPECIPSKISDLLGRLQQVIHI